MTIIDNGIIVNEGELFEGFVLVDCGRIARIGRGLFAEQSDIQTAELIAGRHFDRIDAKHGYILPGVIDDQVHFRDPGLTYKGDIQSESRAAAAGGVTSYMEMPNTVPQTTTIELLEQKHERAAAVSAVNYSFFFGATNDNIEQINRIDPRTTPGVKVFMGSSTGGMLVDNGKRLEAIFDQSPVLVAIHSEDEAIIQANIARYGQSATITDHPAIRSAEACYRSTAKAIDIASKYGTRLHVLHLSTARELTLFEPRAVELKRITNEVCVHHLWFTDQHYAQKGNLIKWNPSIKSIEDREALREGLSNGRLDIVATDHAPHTIEEKQRPYINAPSGGPLVQHSLVAMLEMFDITQVVDYMCHRPALCLQVSERGYLREGYFADIVIVERAEWQVQRSNILYKCGWSPFEGQRFTHRVAHTFINGAHIYCNGQIDSSIHSQALTFIR